MVSLGKGLPAAALFWLGEGQGSDMGFCLGWGRGEGWSLVPGDRARAELSAQPSGVCRHLEPPRHRRSPPHASYDHFLRLYGIKQQYAQAVIYMEAVNDFS